MTGLMKLITDIWYDTSKTSLYICKMLRSTKHVLFRHIEYHKKRRIGRILKKERTWNNTKIRTSINYFWLFLIGFAYRIVCMEVGITAALGIITIREGFLAVCIFSQCYKTALRIHAAWSFCWYFKLSWYYCFA